MTTVAVVGGGCAGVLATRELLSNTDDRVVLIEPDEPGGGLAYGAARPWHLLNSRAGAMSADSRDPGHFARWAGCSPDEFRPRVDYGRYLRDVLSDISGPRLTIRRSRAAGLSATGVVLADGAEVKAERVVVATGSPAPAQPAARPDHPDYVADPWAKGALEAIPSDVPVLLVGAGLTAIDVALTLTEGDRDAPITAVSRRGQLPLTHTEVAAPPVGPALDDCATLRDVVRAVRAEAARAGDWRAVVDGLRPYLDQLWTAFTPAEQDAFLRHLARPWECHRHRMAPSVGARVATLREEGRLEVRAGGVRSMTAPPAGGLLVELEAGVQWFGAVVNCAGPGRLPAAAGSFVGGLLAAGQARVGPHGLGLDIDASGRLIAADGRVQEDRWLIGPLRRGALWETTAVPEIRAQAHNLAIPV
ncbi:FAD/NAD(P)-binding protein [Paractinoplanes lichenicola]|uniref:FAD/NAD(P)-binding protein n=1 Tax=Paractinoplanes lichenicola TaxID=2802976 RepID=A0ABS1VHN4_9ACTN|nr:FAD/NAD(P)-binding protein [Actinoplanes lichenicola]MBL7254179.1 FAD/NAD(P)-binding protein [Actinoplanes lichenicola]